MASLDDFLTDPSALALPWVDSPFFDAQLEARAPSAEWAALARAYRADGYLALPGFVEEELLDRIVERYPWLFDPDSDFGLAPDTDRVVRGDPARRQDAWVIVPAIRELACHPRLRELLAFLYGRRPIPFQTLNFMRGTQQPAHSDALHFSTLPARFMCGAWVALEDVHADAGPLLYYPGSHRLPAVGMNELGFWPEEKTVARGADYASYEDYVRAVAHAGGLEERRLVVPRGTLLLWASDLLHGGAPVERADSTRRSQVTHYFFEGCIYYAPILSATALGELYLRPVYDLTRDEAVGPSLNGEPLLAEPVGAGRSRLRRPAP